MTPPFIHIDKMAPGSLIMKKRTQKESKKNKKPTKKARKIIWSNSVDEEDLYTAPVRKCNNEDNDEDDEEEEDDPEEDQNQKHKNEDNSEDDEDYNEDKEDDPQEDKDSETNSAASLISEKEQWIEGKKTGRHQIKTRRHQIKQQQACFLKMHLLKNYQQLSRLS